jgi:hypothetical protein
MSRTRIATLVVAASIMLTAACGTSDDPQVTAAPSAAATSDAPTADTAATEADPDHPTNGSTAEGTNPEENNEDTGEAGDPEANPAPAQAPAPPLYGKAQSACSILTTAIANDVFQARLSSAHAINYVKLSTSKCMLSKPKTEQTILVTVNSYKNSDAATTFVQQQHELIATNSAQNSHGNYVAGDYIIQQAASIDGVSFGIVAVATGNGQIILAIGKQVVWISADNVPNTEMNTLNQLGRRIAPRVRK